jgi:hypothetical protein
MLGVFMDLPSTDDDLLCQEIQLLWSVICCSLVVLAYFKAFFCVTLRGGVWRSGVLVLDTLFMNQSSLKIREAFASISSCVCFKGQRGELLVLS